MKVDKAVVLQEIYYNCLQSRKEINEKLQNNKSRICELEAFMRSITDNEMADFKFFSPRDAESIYSDRIKEINSEKENIEKDNRDHYHKLNQLDKQIEQLEMLLKNYTEAEDADIKKEAADNNNDSFGDDSYKHLKVLDIQEKERQRIAGELHDSSVQNMTHLVHMIELSSMFIDQDPIRAKLELASCIKSLKEVIDEIRDTIFNLRPMSFDDLGFKQCIEDYIANAKLHYDGTVIYDICDIEVDQYKNKEAANLVLVTVYRIIQEALLNALKHSKAEEIMLKVEVRENTLLMEVSDNGKGFDIEKLCEQQDKHFGISVMKERIDLLNGNMDIETTPNKGTRINVAIPLHRKETG